MIPGRLFYDGDDLDAMALCAWREARGEGECGMRAVMHVIVNRAASWYSRSLHPIHEAVYAKNQFSSMSIPGDREFNLQPSPEDKAHHYCCTMAEEIAKGIDPDPTNGALYYWNPRTATSVWFNRSIVAKPEEHPKLASIGNHDFYA